MDRLAECAATEQSTTYIFAAIGVPSPLIVASHEQSPSLTDNASVCTHAADISNFSQAFRAPSAMA